MFFHICLTLGCAKMLPKLSKSLQKNWSTLKERRVGKFPVKSPKCKASVGRTFDKSREINLAKVKIAVFFIHPHLDFEFYTISTLPGEIVKLIMDYTVAGKRKLDVGFYSRRKLDQICEGIQRRKFLTLINTITVSLFNTILFNRMELGKKHEYILRNTFSSIMNSHYSQAVLPLRPKWRASQEMRKPFKNWLMKIIPKKISPSFLNLNYQPR